MAEIINNYLSPSNFAISIARIPNVEFFTQKITIPSITSTAVEIDTPLAAIYMEQDKLQYGDLELSFIVDENMNNYKEILNWMEGIASPESTKQRALIDAGKDGVTSDIILTVTNSHKNPNLRFKFTNCFPTNLGQIDLDINVQDVAYATCSVTMRYDTMQMEQL